MKAGLFALSSVYQGADIRGESQRESASSVQGSCDDLGGQGLARSKVGVTSAIELVLSSDLTWVDESFLTVCKSKRESECLL